MTKRKKRELGGSLEVDGYPLRWSLKSEQIWDPKGDHVGLRLSVERADENHRELVLEYPFREGGRIARPAFSFCARAGLEGLTPRKGLRAVSPQALLTQPAYRHPCSRRKGRYAAEIVVKAW